MRIWEKLSPVELKNRYSVENILKHYSFSGLFICCLLIYLCFFHNALIDDAYITLAYSRNLINNGVWGLLNNQIANTATSPVNILLLSLLGIIFGESPNLALIASFFQLFVSLIYLEKISDKLFHQKLYGRIIAILLALNPFLVSTIGLESYLYITLIILSIDSYLSSSWKTLAIILGMLTITRPDGILFLLIFLMFLPNIRLLLPVLGVYFVSILPWYIFSWIYLGSIIPDTFFIKSSQSSWSIYSFVNGELLYLNRYPFETIISFSAFASFFFLFFKNIREAVIIKLLLLLAVAHYLGYSIIRVPPYHWYYAPDIALFTMITVFSAGLLKTTCKKMIHLGGTVLWGYTLICSLSMGYLIVKSNGQFSEMPVHSNWATQSQYKEIGLWLKNFCRSAPIQFDGEIGSLEYYSDCYLIDAFSDRNWVHDYISYVYSENTLKNMIFKINYAFYQEPPQRIEYKYTLVGYKSRTTEVDNYVMKWETSSKWLPDTEYYLIEITK